MNEAPDYRYHWGEQGAPERLWAYWDNGVDPDWDTEPRPGYGSVEYVRIDIFAAQFAKFEAIRDAVHRWIDSKQGSSPDSMLEILEILYPTPRPTGTKKAGQSNE